MAEEPRFCTWCGAEDWACEGNCARYVDTGRGPIEVFKDDLRGPYCHDCGVEGCNVPGQAVCDVCWRRAV